MNIKKTLTEFILDYKWLIIGGLILFVPSLILLKFFPVNPNGCTINGFCLTLSSLWGAVTSIFIFDSWINIPVFITLLLIFVFIEYVLPKETIKKQARYSSALMYLTGIAANLVYIILAPTKLSQGPSGVIEGLYGIIFGLTFVNILINPFLCLVHLLFYGIIPPSIFIPFEEGYDGGVYRVEILPVPSQVLQLHY